MTDIFKNRGKKGQFTMTFNWIYVLIAGGIILLFFVGLVVKQKDSSEQKLNYDITRILESILTAASVSEQTKNFVDTSGLVDYSIYFDCEIGSEGSFQDVFSGYGLDGTSATVETPIQVIFAPKEVSAPEIVIWSLPYEMPFKVIDMLMLTSSNTKYYVLGDPGTASADGFLKELENITNDLNFEFVTSFDDMEPGDNHHVKIIDFDYIPVGDSITDNGPVPEKLKTLNQGQLSAISFMDNAGGFVNFYTYDEDSKTFEIEYQYNFISMITLVPEERDATKYAAIFAGGAEGYMCNMMKAFKRLEIVSEVYLNKYNQLVDYYAAGSEPDQNNQNCRITLSGDNSIELLNSAATSCVENNYLGCTSIEDYAYNVQTLNEKLYEYNCVTVY